MPSLAVVENVAAGAGLDLSSLPSIRPAGLYVHVPFCFHKCHYCDFYSITRQSGQRMERFVDLVLAEAELWGQSTLELAPSTVFIGGGTPSLLPPPMMERLLEGLKTRFELAQVAEWTIEVNPATADCAYLRMLRARGVDRLSLGAQSFNPGELATLERHHDPAAVEQAVRMARDAGFARISVDLIYGIPGQTMQSWGESLAQALALGTEHISCYGLTYEPNTPLAVRRRLGRIQAAPESLELQMFEQARRACSEAGKPAYELSNYAIPGCESLHNLGYWTGESYIGLGPSAASHLEGTRFRNQPHLGRWEQAVCASQLPLIELEHLSGSDRAGELAMLNLRLERGIDIADFRRRTGADPRDLFSDAITRLCRVGLLAAEDRFIRVTDKGWPVADGIAADFMHEAKCR